LFDGSGSQPVGVEDETTGIFPPHPPMNFTQIGDVLQKAQTEIQELKADNAQLKQMIGDIHRLLFPQHKDLPDTPETPTEWFGRYQATIRKRAAKQ
jgi:hypothetical protein